MIKKTIGIATILLLILVIVLVAGIGGAKASTGSVQGQLSELHTVALNQFNNVRSGLLLTGLPLESTLGVVAHQNLLTASARGVLRFEALPNALRPNLALGQTVYTLDSLASVSGAHA